MKKTGNIKIILRALIALTVILMLTGAVSGYDPVNLQSPPDGSTVDTTTPTLTWTITQIFVYYIVHIYSDQGILIHFSPLEAQGVSYQVPSGILSEGNTYYWDVWRYDPFAGQWTFKTKKRSFTVKLEQGLTLSPSDISLSNPNPAVGETVTITATIHNGIVDTTDVIVQFFDGDPDTGGTQIGNDQTIASINAGGTGTAHVDWTATPGSHDIYVVADPYDDIPESNENNNEAHKSCVVEPGQPNVAITDISASPDPVSPGDTVTITVDTRNDGAAGFADVGVTVWDPSGDYICNLKWQGYNFEEGETPTLTYLYTVPDDAELGSYDVGAGAWNDCTGTCPGQCCPDGLCSGPHNDGLKRYGVFKVHEQPNVAITNIFASPDPVSPGDTVTITVDTCNDGVAGFADVGVTVWGPSGDPPCNLKWQGYNFEEGETPTLTYLYIVPDDAELGSYDVGAGAWNDCTGTCPGQCCPEGLCSGPHNDGLKRDGVFEVEVLSGSLTLTVMNAAGKSLPDCGGTIEVKLLDTDYICIKTESQPYSGGELSVQVQFDNLANEQHFIEVYHIPNSDLKLKEYWGGDEVTVSDSTPKDFVRHTQVVYDVKINGESPYENEIVVNAGEQVHVDITVKNFEAGTLSKNVEVRLILDQDKSSPYDFDETHGPISISQNGEDDFCFDCPLEEAGTYYFYIVVRGEYNSNYIIVDQHNWYKAVVLSGSLTLTVKNAAGKSLPDCGGTIDVVLFDKDYIYIETESQTYSGGESSIQVQFDNLVNEQHFIEVYHTPNSDLKLDEFWGVDEVTVSGSTPKDFVRHTQVVYDVNINGKSPYGNEIVVNAGDQVHVEITVKNFEAGTSSKNVEVRLILDQEKSSPYDFDETQGGSIPQNGERVFGFDFYPEGTGTYYFYIVVRGEYDEYIVVDQHDWYKAIVASLLPDLTLSPSDITLSNPNPAVGETVAITATIHNTGNADATDVIVQFFDGDPDTGGTQIGTTQTIASINAGGTGTAQVDWTATSGSHDIYVAVDPYDDILESNENNNEAHITCVIEPGQPNVAITNIFASPDHVSPGDNVTITVDTRNDGAAGFADVGVTVWGPSGDYLCNLKWQGYNFEEGETPTLTYLYTVPDDAELGSYDVGAGAWNDCTGTCEGQCCPDGLCSGPHNDGLKREGVFEVELPDLTISPEGISFPRVSIDGDTIKVTVAAEVRNVGTVDVEEVLVRFFNGDPETGHQIGDDLRIRLPAGSIPELEADFIVGQGEGTYDIYVVVDPEDTILECNDDANPNTAHKETTIEAANIAGVPCYSHANYDSVPGEACGPISSACVIGYHFGYNLDENQVEYLIWLLMEAQEYDNGVRFDNAVRGLNVICLMYLPGYLALPDYTVSWAILEYLIDCELPMIYFVCDHQPDFGGPHYAALSGYVKVDSNRWLIVCAPPGGRKMAIDWNVGYDDKLIYVFPPPTLSITLACPADLAVMDPDGFIINNELNEIPGAIYTETDINGDGDTDDSIIIFDLKLGDYQITVIPEPDAEDTDTYTLEVTAGDTTIVLAEDVQIRDIPNKPYVIESTGTTINAAPVANSNGPYAGNEGSEITFDASGSYDPDGSIGIYEWDFDGDGVYDVSSATSTAIFTWGDDHAGTVELRVTDNNGLSSTNTASITVNNVAPTASFYVEQPEDFILPYHSLTFNGAFTDAGWLDTHAATWDFGDDTIVSGTITEENDQPDATRTTTAEHAYVEPGTYSVTLTVTDDDDGIGHYTTTVTVISAEEAAGMIIDQLAVSIVPAEAPKGVSQKIESAIDKLDQVIDFLDQGMYCDAIGKLDGMITQIEGAIDQVNEQRCSVKECKGKKCSCIADEDVDKLIESLEQAKEGAIAIRDLISAEHPECA